MLFTMQDAPTSGAALTYSAVSASDTFPYDPNGFIHVKNGGGVACNVNVVVPGSTYGQNNPDVPQSLNAGADRIFKMAQGMVDPQTGLITVTFSATASVTAACVRAPAA